MRRLLRSGRFVAVLVPLAVMVIAIGAYGYWTATGVGSIPGNVSGLTAPSPTATNPFWGTVHVSWSTVTLDPAVPAVDPEVTFTVERKPWSGSSWTFVCGTGTTPKPYDVLSCDDSPPATDDYDYRVVAHLRSWTSSAAASVHALVDNVAPTSTLTFPGTGPVLGGRLERRMLELDLRDGGGHRRQRPAAGPGQHPARLGQLLGRRELVLERGSGLEPRERDDELVLCLPGGELPGRRHVHRRGARDRQRAERPVARHEPDVHVRHDASDDRAIGDRGDRRARARSGS